ARGDDRLSAGAVRGDLPPPPDPDVRAAGALDRLSLREGLRPPAVAHQTDPVAAEEQGELLGERRPATAPGAAAQIEPVDTRRSIAGERCGAERRLAQYRVAGAGCGGRGPAVAQPQEPPRPPTAGVRAKRSPGTPRHAPVPH